MIFNSPDLCIPNTRISKGNLGRNKSKILLVGTTAFSLPFERSINLPQTERHVWLRKRALLWRNGLRRSLENALVPFQSIHWLIFLAKGDRQVLDMPRYEHLSNGIFISYVEVERSYNAHDDYYRRAVMVDIVQRYISCYRESMHRSAIITCRVDSDDLVHSDYFVLLNNCIELQANSLLDVTYAFPHGLEFQREKGIVIPKIWPEPPFIARYEAHCTSKAISTVWELPHDQQNISNGYAQVLTTEPVWCITIGIDNMQNASSSYPYCRAVNMNLSSIFKE